MTSSRDPVPPLRPLDLTLIKAGGQQMVRIRDGLGISPDAAVPLPLFALIQLFDGQATQSEVLAAIESQFKVKFPVSELKRIIDELDQAHFLDSPRYRARLREVLDDWEKAPVRAAAHAGDGKCYSDRKDDLEKEMAAIYRRPGAVDPARLTSAGKLRAVFAPHIDFHRGGHSYTWAYHELRRRGAVPLYVVLGTSHRPMEQPFAVTVKDFATPWGAVKTDRGFIDRLERLQGEDLRRDGMNHKVEHSIEFQVVFLRHALGERDFSIVPILVSGFHESVERRTEPDREPRVARFLDALTRAIEEVRAEEGREVVLVGGVDLAHVGQHFGDAERLTPEFLAEVRSRDRELLAAAEAVDSRAFFSELARDGDRRRICGFGPMYSILGVLERIRGDRKLAGELLSYDQAVDLENDLCVSFASLSFEER
jgi:MEMO1 family protein